MTDATDTHLLDDAVWARSLAHDIASQLQGQTIELFYGDPEGRTYKAQLRVTAFNERPPMNDHLRFSLLFLGPQTPQLPSQTYRVRCADQGDFALFISSIGRRTEGFEYEAVVSQNVAKLA
ncbi:hypothetical protein G7047_09585 [Diaphorobacter sp. HDW4A]|uniref:DUF6916 family protein n=1 Tax=Diaphorobacter sp. HDW4A TaxID=2714924 RepID=UPI001409C620|nr:hypothetical protein [Diaphorobacter sp. HDW4A]QIL80127.1 hypothetical protein G7047_09585 [Diaphorobacter sp. HDW4A]